MMESDEQIVGAIGRCFATFGGGHTSEWNPVAAALKDKPLMFAAGVDVRAVVQFVLAAAKKRTKQPRRRAR